MACVAVLVVGVDVVVTNPDKPSSEVSGFDASTVSKISRAAAVGWCGVNLVPFDPPELPEAGCRCRIGGLRCWQRVRLKSVSNKPAQIDF